ncbi:MAG TPA: hypothetical protein VM430_19135, partial [Microbacterium sp.]|nr:hypothetical protein [Microbacterium sp.]
PFMWRTILRVIRLFWRTMVTVPAYTLRKHWKAGDERLLPKWLDFAIDIVRLLVGFAAAITVAAFLFVVALVLTPILPLLSPLLLIPWFKDAAQGVIDGIIESIGDVAAWKERPLRASAMRLVVRNALQKAKDLVGDGDVHLFAHSQGAAVATFTLIQELDPKAFNVRRLTTVGAAVVLLGRESWKGRPDKYSPVADWVAKNDAAEPNERVAWENHWAIWDPFSAGPIADSTADARTRWRDAYFPAPNAVRGPEEHAVHNTSQPFLDHSMYFENTVQVVEPTVRHLLGHDFPKPPQVLGYIENVLAVRDKKSLGINMLAAVVIAALVPGLPRVYAAFAWVVDLFATIIGTVIGFFPGGPTPEKAAEDARGSVSFLTEPDLTPWSWLVASALILAVLIWLNQMVSRWARRAREWDRCPVTPRAWLFLGSIPRAAYVFGAFACVWLAIMNWTAWPHTFGWVLGLTIGLIIVAVFVFVEPLFAPVPVVVPSRQHESEASTPSLIAANAPMKLKTAIATKAYKDDLAARRRRLDPQGRRARAWARVFHRWNPET